MADAQLARFQTMTNVELRAELKRRGCSTSGNKKDLLEKLRIAVEKEYQQQLTLNNSVGYTQNDISIIHDQNQYSTPMIPIPQQLSTEPPPQSLPPQISSTPPEKKTRSRSNRTSNDTIQPVAINNERIVLDTSNNVEVNSFVSKNNEEEQKNIENIGEDIHLPSIENNNSDTTKTETIAKEIPLSDEQQHLNQSEINDETSKSVPIEPTKVESDKPQIKPNRSQISSLSKLSNRSTINKINLTIELLQTLIPDINLLPESLVNDELDSELNNESINGNDILSSDSMTIGELADQKQSINRTVAMNDHSVNKNPIRMSSFESKTIIDGKNNSVLTDEPVRIKDVTITHEPPSEILYIRGLTRPFSLMQLKGLLSRYGTLVDGEFWLDKIKSQCFVTYNTLDDAQNARQALDGCRWPSTNPKTLSVRFARQEEFEYSKTHDVLPDHMSTDSTDRIVEEKPNSPIEEIQSKTQKEKKSGFLITDDEIEVEKEQEQEPVKSNEPPAKGLDDYFRKTKAKPSIYWLPLTEEQIIERIRRQEQRKAERDEEQRKRELNEKRKHSSSPSSRRDSKRH